MKCPGNEHGQPKTETPQKIKNINLRPKEV